MVACIKATSFAASKIYRDNQTQSKACLQLYRWRKLATILQGRNTYNLREAYLNGMSTIDILSNTRFYS